MMGIDCHMAGILGQSAMDIAGPPIQEDAGRSNH